MKLIPVVFLVVFVAACCGLLRGPDCRVHGVVVRIFDGDSITVELDNNSLVKVRLFGVDCPERGQPYGDTAKEAAGSFLLNRRVAVEVVDADRYGRIVGIVFVGDLAVNEMLLVRGLAWLYPAFCTRDICARWKFIEDDAKERRTGLWQEANPIPPWKYRHRGKSGALRGNSGSEGQK